MKNLSMSLLARKRAVSLIEGVLYLVVALSVIVGGIVFFNQAKLANNLTDAEKVSRLIVQSARSLPRDNPVGGLEGIAQWELNDVLIAGKYIPEHYLNVAGDAYMLPGTDVEFYITGGVRIDMELDGIPQEYCMRLLTVNAGGDGPLGSGIAYIDIESADESVIYASAPPITPADIQDICAMGTTGEVNIEFSLNGTTERVAVPSTPAPMFPGFGAFGG